MKHLALWAIRGYQLLISPLLPSACRFYPSCSQYGYEAISRYGLAKGGAMAVWRILRCNPWNDGGYDPVDPADRLRYEHERAEHDRQSSTSSAPTG